LREELNTKKELDKIYTIENARQTSPQNTKYANVFKYGKIVFEKEAMRTRRMTNFREL